MNDLYELFIYRVAHMVYGNKAIYQLRGNYLLQRNTDAKKFIGLRPDITIKRSDGEMDVIDTKWKIPANFAKESDTYQMNACSSCIANIKRVIILYPFVLDKKMVDNYTFLDQTGTNRPLVIRTIDLMKILDWKAFLSEFETVLA